MCSSCSTDEYATPPPPRAPLFCVNGRPWGWPTDRWLAVLPDPETTEKGTESPQPLRPSRPRSKRLSKELRQRKLLLCRRVVRECDVNPLFVLVCGPVMVYSFDAVVINFGTWLVYPNVNGNAKTSKFVEEINLLFCSHLKIAINEKGGRTHRRWVAVRWVN